MELNDDNNNQIISYLTLRKLLGIFGIALPFAMFLCSQFDGYTPLRTSISSYYFTNVREVFVGILAVLAVFFLTYKGYSRLDNITTNFAGFFALCIATFPAMRDCDRDVVSLFPFLGYKTTDMIHTISASLFFLLLAFISFFLFTKQIAARVTARKVMRNRLYQVCGVIIFSCVAVLGIYMILPVSWHLVLEPFRPIFVFESIALFAFGTSWLVKGELFLTDK